MEACLSSVEQQTEQHFEVLCVYDDSSDRTKHIIEEFCSRDGRFFCVMGQKRGLSGARNIGMERARGKYTIFLDGDDMLIPTALEKLRTTFEISRAEMIVFGATWFPDDVVASVYIRKTLSPRDRVYNGDCVKCIFHEQSAKPFVWRDAFKTSFLNNHGIKFNESVQVAEDVVFQFAVFARVKCVCFMKSPLYRYRIYRKQSLMSKYSGDLLVRLQGHIYAIQVVLDDWRQINLLQRYGKDLSIWMMDFIFGTDLEALPEVLRRNICEQTLKFCEEAVSESLKKFPYYARQIQKMLKSNCIQAHDLSFAFRISRKGYHLMGKLRSFKY